MFMKKPNYQRIVLNTHEVCKASTTFHALQTTHIANLYELFFQQGSHGALCRAVALFANDVHRLRMMSGCHPHVVRQHGMTSSAHVVRQHADDVQTTYIIYRWNFPPNLTLVSSAHRLHVVHMSSAWDFQPQKYFQLNNTATALLKMETIKASGLLLALS